MSILKPEVCSNTVLPILVTWSNLLLSCQSDNPRSELPHAPVSIDISLLDNKYHTLSSPGGLVVLDSKETEGMRLGIGGIALVHQIEYSQTPIKAFDLACPYDYREGGRLEIQGLELVCSLCSSHYEVLTALGIPVSGPSRTVLTRYLAHYDQQTQRVSVTNR